MTQEDPAPKYSPCGRETCRCHRFGDKDTEQIKFDNLSEFLFYTLGTKAQKGEETTVCVRVRVLARAHARVLTCERGVRV